MHFHHPLLLEFSEHRDLILRLREKDSTFRQLADDYHAIDRHICRIERELEPATDQQTETLKKERLRLKDLVFHALQVANGEAQAA